MVNLPDCIINKWHIWRSEEEGHLTWITMKKECFVKIHKAKSIKSTCKYPDILTNGLIKRHYFTILKWLYFYPNVERNKWISCGYWMLYFSFLTEIFQIKEILEWILCLWISHIYQYKFTFILLGKEIYKNKYWYMCI